MKKPVVIAASLAVAGFLLLVLVMTHLGKSRQAPQDPEGQKASPKSGAASPPPEKAAPPPLEKSGEAPEEAPATASSARVPALALAISGQVLAEGALAPLPGALVRAAIDRGGRPPGEQRWLREAVAGAGGVFRLDGLTFAPHRLRASLAGYLDREVGSVFPGDEAKLLLASQVGIPCVVEADREKGPAPVPGRKVRLEIPEDGWSLEAETDRDGTFLITGISSEDFEVARKGGHVEAVVSGFADASLMAEPPGDSYSIRVEPGAAVEGSVLDAHTGRPVPNAVLHAESGEEVAADERGSFRIEGVDESLTAYAPGYAPVTKDLDDHEGGDTLRMDFRLDRGLTLRGRVKDSKGGPIASVKVAVAPDELDLDSSSERLEGRLLRILSSVTGPDGSYRIEGLPAALLGLPGEVELEIRPPGAEVGFSDSAEVDAEAGEIEHDIVLDIQQVVAGIVTDAGGSPVARVGILVESADDDFTESAGSDAAGSFELRNLRSGSYRLRVEKEGRVVHLGELSVPAEALRITLAPLAAVKGRVAAEGTGEPLAGLTVSVHASPGQGPPIGPEAATDASGRFAIEGVPRGEAVLFVKPGPREAPYSRLSRQYRQPIAVGEGGWVGEVLYPVLPSGEVVLGFALADGAGGIAPADGAVWVSVASFRPTGERTSPAARGQPILVEEARNGLRARWREGEYRVRCTIAIDGKQVLKEEAFKLEAGAAVERTVTFQR